MSHLYFVATHQNSAGKLSIKLKSRQDEPAITVQWFAGLVGTINEARRNAEDYEQLITLGERLSVLLASDSLEQVVLQHSYTNHEGHVFTPYNCLQSQYCIGVCHNSKGLKVVSYGELFCNYTPIERNDELLDDYTALVKDNTQKTGCRLPLGLGDKGFSQDKPLTITA